MGDGLDHEDAGHDGVVGEVALEVGLVDGDVLDGDDAFGAFDLEDAVDEEEGVAMGEDRHDLEDVERGGVRGGLWIGRGVTHGRDEYNWEAFAWA